MHPFGTGETGWNRFLCEAHQGTSLDGPQNPEVWDGTGSCIGGHHVTFLHDIPSCPMVFLGD